MNGGRRRVGVASSLRSSRLCGSIGSVLTAETRRTQRRHEMTPSFYKLSATESEDLKPRSHNCVFHPQPVWPTPCTGVAIIPGILQDFLDRAVFRRRGEKEPHRLIDRQACRL